MRDHTEREAEPPPKTRPPTCKTHSIVKVRQTAKAPYRCHTCERESYLAAFRATLPPAGSELKVCPRGGCRCDEPSRIVGEPEE